MSEYQFGIRIPYTDSVFRRTTGNFVGQFGQTQLPSNFFHKTSEFNVTYLSFKKKNTYHFNTQYMKHSGGGWPSGLGHWSLLLRSAGRGFNSRRHPVTRRSPPSGLR